MRRIVLAFFLLQTFSNVHAQVTSVTSANIYANLRKLNVLGSVLYIAAHPDDENTRLLAYLANDRLYRTGYLSLTRGDGGQNLIGDEQGIALGLIRTQELLAARRMDGAEQFFTRAYDFGFSKNPEETFTKWDREKILSDVVWVIRKFQPDVIITRFPTTGEGGHGHHTASAILANEAFTAAADPKRFPEQLKWVQPWQAKRILWNTFNFGSTNTIRDDQFKIDVGGYNAILGKSYGEIAAESRSQHKSQGFGVARSRGEAWEYFTKTGGANFKTDLMDDVTQDWSRLKGAGNNVQQLIENTIQGFDFMQPQKSVPQLVQIYTAIKALPDGYWKQQKLKEIQNLIEQCSGLWLEAFTTEQYVAQTDSLRIGVSLNNRLGIDAVLKNIVIDGADTVLNKTLAKNINFNYSKNYFVSADQPITQPYWLVNKMEEGYFNVADQTLIGIPDVQPAYEATFTLTINGQDFTFTKPVKYKYTDPVKGEIYQPLVVVPPLSVYTNPGQLLFKNDMDSTKSFTIQAVPNKNISFKKTIAVAMNLKPPLQVKDSASTFTKGVGREYIFHVPRNNKNGSELFVLPMVYVDTTSANHLALSTIRYDHIPSINYFSTDPVKILNMDLTVVGKKIGYIVGAGDKVPQALEDMGYDVTILTDKELSRNNLQQFDAIISGVRAYNTDEWLNSHYNQLMQYVAGGGNLIVQYNRSNQQGTAKAKIGPYDFNVTANRVTDENAPVTFLKPQHPVLNYPNKITAKDFEGWVQERSIYHAAGYDKNFETILSMHDKNEQPDEGSLIIAKYGKGYFTYTGIVFFRELPAGVPGAYRLLANIIALNKKKEF